MAVTVSVGIHSGTLLRSVTRSVTATFPRTATGVLPPVALAHPCAAAANGILSQAALAHPCVAAANGILPQAALAHPCAAEHGSVCSEE